MTSCRFQEVIFRKGDEDFTYYSAMGVDLRVDDYRRK
jgi:hypothetical protein